MIIQCCGSALVSVRIWIKLCISVRFRIQGAKSLRIHADTGPDPDSDPGQTLKPYKVDFLHEKYTLSW